MAAKTPLTLITGTLGSGKTTLLRHLLRHADRRLAVLMNEFGEIAIDSRVVSGENIRMVELAGGCVCCELTGEFEAAVRELLATAAPQHIVLEATGVAESEALVYEVQESLPEVRLDCTVGVVDADTSVRFPQVGHVGRMQLEAADMILINKLDLVSGDQADAVTRQIRRHNDRAVLLRTTYCTIDPQIVFGPHTPSEKRTVHPDRFQHRHQERPFESFVYESGRPIERGCFEQLAAALGERVVRAKGFLKTPQGGFLYNQVVSRWELEPFAAERTQLVFIGWDLDNVQAEVVRHLNHCAKLLPKAFQE
ncbi:MAG: GTP-binding protein [Desulfobacteraceae bacterium]|nr:MAG: GTP-binding protein [Desulfobacteraceae bacterium]